MGQRTMILDPVGDLRQLRDERSDWLLTVLTGVLILLIFVFAPLQAVGITALSICYRPVTRDHRKHGLRGAVSSLNRPSFLAEPPHSKQ
jgi:hypothetical protein